MLSQGARHGLSAWAAVVDRMGIQRSQALRARLSSGRYRGGSWRSRSATSLAGRGGIKRPRASGPLTKLVDEWLEARKTTHRSANQDRLRWQKHLRPVLGRYAPDDVDVGMLKRLIHSKLADGMSPATVRLLMRLVSTLYSDLIDDGKATQNPAKLLPKAARKLLKPTYDPKRTPFIQKREDIGRLYRALYAEVSGRWYRVRGFRARGATPRRGARAALGERRRGPADHLRSGVGRRSNKGQGRPGGAHRGSARGGAL